ncbi:MAG: tetrahydrofolate dehydrogenase/cyclohydrolase catalytic domain-containing protein [Actinomycetota bacterium]
MTARIIDGKAIAAQVRAEVADRVKALLARGVRPGLAAVLVGDDPASHVYVGSKQRACAEVGMYSERVELPADVSEATVIEEIERLNADPAISGLIVQLPVPKHLSDLALLQAVAPEKDVDCLGPTNVGLMVRGRGYLLPATPYGIVELLVREGIQVRGQHVVVVGRSGLVGMPLAIMLAQKSDRANATVTICHTLTQDVGSYTRQADVLVVAVGRPRTVTEDMVKPGAVVVDVGMNRTEDGLVGDVAFDEVKEVAGAITPVPGGVGPMTVAMLMVNTVAAAEAQATRRPDGGIA